MKTNRPQGPLHFRSRNLPRTFDDDEGLSRSQFASAACPFPDFKTALFRLRQLFERTSKTPLQAGHIARPIPLLWRSRRYLPLSAQQYLRDAGKPEKVIGKVPIEVG